MWQSAMGTILTQIVILQVSREIVHGFFLEIDLHVHPASYTRLLRKMYPIEVVFYWRAALLLWTMDLYAL